MPYEFSDGTGNSQEQYVQQIDAAFAGLIASGALDAENPEVQSFLAKARAGHFAKGTETPEKDFELLKKSLNKAYEENNEADITRITKEIEDMGLSVRGTTLIGQSAYRFKQDEDYLVRHTLHEHHPEKGDLKRNGHGTFARVIQPMIRKIEMGRPPEVKQQAVADIWD